jgi:hypothetical protein
MFCAFPALPRLPRDLRFALLGTLLLFLAAPSQAASNASAAGKKSPSQPAPDTLVFVNGDRLSGKLVRAVGDEVVFHSEIVGDLTVKWDKIKELHTQTQLAVLEGSIFSWHRQLPAGIPEGTLSVANQLITVHPLTGPAIAPIPLKRAPYIVDENTLNKQIAGHPGLFAGWNGTLTAGATIVQASEDQYTFAGSVGLSRSTPTVSWLDTQTRSSLDFSGSFGKIIQPAYANDGVMTPASSSKSSIYHAAAERDGYFSPRFYVLGQTTFDHNFSQDLDLQQIYGAGIGWTAVKSPSQELDVKSTLQYEGQTFIAATPGEDQNLIGSTFNSTWAAKLPHKVQFKQQLSWIPAYNNTDAYAAAETDSLTMPFLRKLAFSVGSNDSYLNDPPPADPPTKRNSFQFTTGLTYAIKSKY